MHWVCDTYVQCIARPMVIFPAAEHHWCWLVLLGGVLHANKLPKVVTWHCDSVTSGTYNTLYSVVLRGSQKFGLEGRQWLCLPRLNGLELQINKHDILRAPKPLSFNPKITNIVGGRVAVTRVVQITTAADPVIGSLVRPGPNINYWALLTACR